MTRGESFACGAVEGGSRFSETAGRGAGSALLAGGGIAGGASFFSAALTGGGSAGSVFSGVAWGGGDGVVGAAGTATFKGGASWAARGGAGPLREGLASGAFFFFTGSVGAATLFVSGGAGASAFVAGAAAGSGLDGAGEGFAWATTSRAADLV
ncbi:MAG TPA: hypothetical protein VLS90_12410, partial [Thermodesulfobacteriota bacterium]|nr:hypothetical protein [Thermodesulfobacteriota bacterium]